MKKSWLIILLASFIFFLFSLILILFLIKSHEQKLASIPALDSKNLFTQVPPITQLTATPATPSPITFIFTGDLMMDRHIRQKAQETGYDFILENLTSLFNSVDMVISNLEGPITTQPSRSMGSVVGSTNNYIFTFEPAILETLLKNNITLVNLGNNHTLNFGQVGLSSTKEFLREKNINFFGAINNESDIYYYQTQDLTIAFISYNQFTPAAEQLAKADIITAKSKADLLILYPHWGNEYETSSSKVIQTQAHEFIDLGVDLIIGSHPHVVQESELYQGKTIYYSLGNFVFDQYFSPQVQAGLLVKVTIDPQSLAMDFEEIPIALKQNSQTVLAD